MDTTKNIDDLVRRRREKRAELAEIGSEIMSSARDVVVLFIDLTDSTAMKESDAPESWLGYIFEFIESIDKFAKESKGTVVKRIGDELMLTFQNVEDSESFLQNLDLSGLANQYRYKIAIDFGEAYHFKFGQHLEDDPYGQVVDRCARIAKLANADAVLCSSSYKGKLQESERYISLGEFKLKGFSLPEEIFLRTATASRTPDPAYIEPLVSSLNDSQHEGSGYRYVSRKFTADFFSYIDKSQARPFLIRELLNIPKLPYTLAEFDNLLSTLGSNRERDFYGCLVEWEAIFDSYEVSRGEIKIRLKPAGNVSWRSVRLLLVPSMLEIVRAFSKDQKIRFRGIISDILISINLNYVDIELPDAQL
jgi:class 3 adenylate cyclase